MAFSFIIIILSASIPTVLKNICFSILMCIFKTMKHGCISQGCFICSWRIIAVGGCLSEWPLISPVTFTVMDSSKAHTPIEMINWTLRVCNERVWGSCDSGRCFRGQRVQVCWLCGSTAAMLFSFLFKWLMAAGKKSGIV